MSCLKALNVFVLQWFFIRLAKVVDDDTGLRVGWTIIKWVWPLTGWSTPFKFLGKKK